MTDSSRMLALASAALAGLPEALAPATGCELSIGEAEMQESGGLPPGDLCVLPLELSLADQCVASLAIAAETTGLAPIGRRLRGDEDPDKERDLDEQDLEGIGDALALMGGALASGLRAKLSPDLSLDPGSWWRTEEPGPALPEGSFHCVRAELSLAGGGAVALTLRLPDDIFRAASGGPCLASVEGLPEEACAAIKAALEAAGIAILEPDAGAGAGESDPAAEDGTPDLFFLDAESAEALERCRALRLGDATWNATIVACTAAPTRDLVLRALEEGASHVLALPPDERALRVLLRT